MSKENFMCPIEDCECPYYNNGACGLDNPLEDCDDAASFEEEAVVFVAVS